MKFLRYGLAVCLLSLGLFGGKALAAKPTSITAKGISLTPAIENLTLSGSPSTSFIIQIDNHGDSAVSLSTSSLDFKSLNETGGLAFIGSSSSAIGYKYGLASWLNLPTAPIVLKPHSSQQITIGVSNRSDLYPGGHYAAILFKKTGGSGSSSNQVGVNQVIATLVFLKKSGGEIYSLSLQKPDFPAAWLKIPSNLDLLFTNTGNTQTAPRGSVVITDPLGREIKRGIINPDSSLTLPDSTRLYTTQLYSIVNPWIPGRYKATVRYRPDDVSQLKTTSYSFVYLSLPFVILGSALLMAVVIFVWSVRRSIKRARRVRKIPVKIL